MAQTDPAIENEEPTADVKQAARILRVHPKTVLKMIDDGKLAAGKLGRGG
ncbi:hypothetical protein C8245_23145 [Paracidovorax avenae]|nr:hypothetical protein C8245_23145 [Paracidovorax avenae]